MLRAIALTPIWDDAKEEIIEGGKEFSMGDDRINSLITIGAAKLVEPSKEITPQQTKQKISES